eukprot:4069663-Prymnesium_polylepis.3
MPSGETRNRDASHPPVASLGVAGKKKKKKKTTSRRIDNIGAERFATLPRADEYDDDYFDSEVTEELAENGRSRRPRLDTAAHTHGRPGETTIARGEHTGGGGMGILDSRAPTTMWMERRGGGAFCECCGGVCWKSAIRQKQQIVALCGCCVLLISVSAMGVLVWLRSRVDAHESMPPKEY